MERATHHRHGGGPRAMLLVVLTTAPVPAATQTFDGDCERRKPDVTLVWYDVFGVFGGSHEPAAAELRGVLCRIGVSADSRLAAPGSAYAADGAVEVAVMLLRSFGGDAAEHERVMGVVPAGLPPGVPRPVRVYLAGIETALGRSLWGEPSPDAILGRAVGRVVAHELFHALAPWEPHADSGLMQASLTRDALVGPVPEVDATHARALQGVLSRRGVGPSRTLWAGADVDHVLTAGPAPAAAF